MNDLERFEKIAHFLSLYENMWRYEILETYPNHLDAYKKEWLEDLKSQDDHNLYQIDIFGNSNSCKNEEFKSYLDQIGELSKIEFIDIPQHREYPSWTFHKVKEKKVHEIQVIISKLKELKNITNYQKIVDIGGGVGHLSRTLAHYHQTPCISLDINKEFQEIGKKRLDKFPKPDGACDVEFINHDFSKDLNDQQNSYIFNKDTFSIGLHTCGPLANHHLNIHLKEETAGILNFGCCYNRLRPNQDMNLSKKAKENPINYSDYSLTLAARGHDSMSFEDFLFKKRVKYYRYGLHLFLVKKLKRDDIYAVGDSHKRYYNKSFANFITHKLKELNIAHDFNEKEIEDFYEHIKEDLHDMFLANIIRWQIGRLLELHILIDRVLYLRENNQEATLKRYFHSKLSPRNLGILSLKKINE